MSVEDLTDEYITYESRLASFQKSVKKRGSSANGRGTKALGWPHKTVAPENLAQAGLFFNPSPENPDNTSCFLCHKNLDGWEENDDPLLEHVKHAPACGWAIVTAIEAEIGNYALEDPSQPFMKDARKATFAGRWPHDGKKGWKCKTKQLVDAGWKYTPTSDSDDMATCVYCQLALDGWEPNDKPLDEHYKRSPGCTFFALLDEAKTAKKGSRSKGNRTSKASRLSVQSVATVASETMSVGDLTAAPEDSVLTTASTMTQGGKKSRAKKAATAKGRKTKAKKDEVHEIEVSMEEQPSKPARGRKRGSVAVDDSILTVTEAPAAKKRATRKRGSNAVNNSVLEAADDSDMMDALAPKKTGGRKKAATATRNPSATSQASSASVASLRAPPGSFPDDDEIERQLEADLERPLSEDEDITADSDSERIKAQLERAKDTKGVTPGESADYAMFNPDPVDADDAEVEDELRALQAEMEVDEPQTAASPEPEPEPELHVPKKGKKAGTRKASKQAKTKKTKAAEPAKEEEQEQEPEEVPVPEPELEADELAVNESMFSTDTVINKTAPARSSTGKRGRGRPSKASLVAQELVQEPNGPTESIEAASKEDAGGEPAAEVPVKRGRGRPSKASLASRDSLPVVEAKSEEPAPKRGRGRPSKKSLEARKSLEQQKEELELVEEVKMEEAAEVPPSDDRPAPSISFEAPAASSVLDENSRPGTSSSNRLPPVPLTPGHAISPAPSARQAAISPSQSPQSSDAENQPPSSKANTSIDMRTVDLSSTTPAQSSSPSKRNVIGGLQTDTPWNAVDLDAVLGSPSKFSEKENTIDRFLKQGRNLTSPEKRMTVDEWIYYNASEAEKKLKADCEAMVSRFESEGTKAMRVLEGLVAE